MVDPPGEVLARVTGATLRSLTIKMEGANQENPISGYIVNYKSNTEDWEEIKILGTRNNFVLENLRCGTKYSISITPYNKAGPSPDTKMFHATTSGNGELSFLQLLLFIMSKSLYCHYIVMI